jgi:hypothetical protein
VPKERLFITRDVKQGKHQQTMKNWLEDVDLFMSDDFFKTQKLVLEGANKLVKTDHFMFASKYSTA